MEDERKIKYVLQWLHERGYRNALKSLEDEVALSYCETDFERGFVVEEALDNFQSDVLCQIGDTEGSATNNWLVEPGDGKIPSNNFSTISNAHMGGVICVKCDREGVHVATSSADKGVKLWKFQDLIEKKSEAKCFAQISCTAPALCIDFSPNHLNNGLFAFGGMDGSIAICKLDDSITPGSMLSACPTWHAKGINVENILSNHSKYVVRVKWSKNGEFLASCSYDKTVNIYSCQKKADGKIQFERVKQLFYPTNVEDIEFTPNDSHLIISRREYNYLIYISLTDFQQTLYNMNQNLDDHVSFSALNLNCFSFTDNNSVGEMLLISTDKDRILIMETHSNKHIKNLYGARNDGYSQPRSVFHTSGKYVFSTSQDNQIYAWDIVSQKVVATLKGHTTFPRDICMHPTGNVLISVSYDKSIRIWDHFE